MHPKLATVRTHLHRHGAAYAVLLICLACVVALYLFAHKQLAKRDEARFKAAAAATFGSAQSRLAHHVDLVFASRGIFVAGQGSQYKAWEKFFKALDLKGSYPGLLDVGFLSLVQARDKAAHNEEMEREWYPGYKIYPVSTNEVSYPLIYLFDRMQGIQLPVGWDAATENSRRQAIERARDTGQATSTGNIRLMLHDRQLDTPGFIVYLPVYRDGGTPDTLEARREQISGFVFASFLPGQIWQSEQNAATGLGLVIDEGADSARTTRLLRAEPGMAGAATVVGQANFPLDRYGRHWVFSVRRSEGFGPEDPTSWLGLGLVGGMVVSFLLFSIVLQQGRARAATAVLNDQISHSARRLQSANRALEVKVEELQKARDALRSSHEYTQNLIESSIDMIISLDPERRITGVNLAVERTYGYSRQELLDRPVAMLHADEASYARVAESLERQGAYGGEFLARRKDGRPFPVYLSASMLRDEQQRVIGLIGISRDITDRKRYEDSLAAEKERLAVTLRSIADGVITTDVEGRITLMNEAAERLTGWMGGRGMGQPIQEVFNVLELKSRRPAENAAARVLRAGDIFGAPTEAILVGADGTERSISETGAPMCDPAGRLMGVVVVFRDVTESKKLSDELLKASKMESIGLLAGGIAHDFNNILTGIMGNVSLVKLNLTGQVEVEFWLNQAEKACLRARELTQQLLTFAKGGLPVRSLTALDALAREAADFAVRGAAVRCDVQCPPDLWAAEVDQGQMTQVLHNLIINAKEAMPEGGVIHLILHNTELPPQSPLALPTGRYVSISVCDSGLGIKPEHLGRIFEPYFSTKQRGSGLGLATAYSIVKKHGGLIEVQSELNRGTTFTVHLPASDKMVTQRTDGESAVRFGSGRILVMDDDSIIRNLARAMLARLGYEVELAPDGSVALEAYQAAMRSGKVFQATILDLTVPGAMGGKEAVRKLLDIDPQARVIVSSGYSNDPVLADYRSHGFKAFVAKPYSIQDLSHALDQVLNGNG